MDYGNVCVSNSKKDWKAWVIKFITRSKWSHSFITVPDMIGEPMVLEASGSGVSFCSFNSHYRNDPTQGYRVYRFKVDLGLRDKSLLSLLPELQTSYGHLELPWFGWRALNKLFGKDIKHRNNWVKDGTICSELVAQYITNAGYPWLFSGFGVGSINAQDIFEICEAHPDVFELIENKE